MAAALGAMKRLSELAPGDADVWLELAQLQHAMPDQLPMSQKAYEKAVDILKQATSGVPWQLWANLGAVRHRLGEFDNAKQAYGYAIRAATHHGAALCDDACVTVHFNLGRLHESGVRITRRSLCIRQSSECGRHFLTAFYGLQRVKRAWVVALRLSDGPKKS